MHSPARTQVPECGAKRPACSRVEVTYQQLKRDIMEGVYTPRQRLIETDIALLLGSVGRRCGRRLFGISFGAFSSPAVRTSRWRSIARFCLISQVVMRREPSGPCDGISRRCAITCSRQITLLSPRCSPHNHSASDAQLAFPTQSSASMG
jgi:hypothetical protein